MHLAVYLSISEAGKSGNYKTASLWLRFGIGYLFRSVNLQIVSLLFTGSHSKYWLSVYWGLSIQRYAYAPTFMHMAIDLTRAPPGGFMFPLRLYLTMKFIKSLQHFLLHYKRVNQVARCDYFLFVRSSTFFLSSIPFPFNLFCVSNSRSPWTSCIQFTMTWFRLESDIKLWENCLDLSPNKLSSSMQCWVVSCKS